jgi:hypothetical protein
MDAYYDQVSKAFEDLWKSFNPALSVWPGDTLGRDGE